MLRRTAAHRLLWLFFLAALCSPSNGWAQEAPAVGPSARLDLGGGYEAVVGVTWRAQALIVFDGRTDERLAVMTGEFVPSPTISLLTPFRPIRGIDPDQTGRSRFGYYWKISFNSFTMDRQEDPETGGIGTASPIHDYGTAVDGWFLAAAPVVASEALDENGRVRWRGELGLGAGYLSLAGNMAVEEPAGSGTLVRKDLDFTGPAFFIFAAGQYFWKGLVLGFQIGTAATSTEPYSFSQSFVTLETGLRFLF